MYIPSSHIYNEHGFTNNYDHVEGTNRYMYRYPDSWRQYYYTKHMVGIRSIELIPAAREFEINGMSIKNNSGLNISISFSSTINTGQTMTEYNKELNKIVNDRYEQVHETGDTQLKRGSYAMKYDCKSKSFSFYVATTDDCYFHFDYRDKIVSKDLESILNITDGFFLKLADYLNDDPQFPDDESFTYEQLMECKDMKHINIKWMDEVNHEKPYVITFYNVWDRERVYVSSSLVGHDKQFLGFSNCYYNPPKYFQITNSDNRFYIDLFDSVLNPVELPKDKADTLVIESILFVE